MDPRDRADAMLTRASARRRDVVTPDNAISPMDASSTSRIPRAVIQALDEDPDTLTIPAPAARVAPPAAAREPIAEMPAVSGEVPAQQQATAPRALDDAQETTPLGGLIPTVQHQSSKPSLADRLSGRE